MRAFVFLLILANLAFAAWTHGYIRMGGSPDALRVQRQFNPEQLSIVARDEPPPFVENNGKAERGEKIVAKTGKDDEARESKPAEFCLKTADVPAEAAVAIVETLNEKWPAVRVQRTAQAGSASFWVFIPPQPTRKDAENKAAELKKLGVPEFYIVQDGAQARAISVSSWVSIRASMPNRSASASRSAARASSTMARMIRIQSAPSARLSATCQGSTRKSLRRQGRAVAWRAAAR